MFYLYDFSIDIIRNSISIFLISTCVRLECTHSVCFTVFVVDIGIKYMY